MSDLEQHIESLPDERQAAICGRAEVLIAEERARRQQNGIPNPLYTNLSDEERSEYKILTARLAKWVEYVELTRKENADRRKSGGHQTEIDVSRNISDQDHYRIDELRSKAYGRTEPYAQPYLGK